MNLHEIKFNNPGVMCDTMPSELFEEVKKNCDYQIANKSNGYALRRAAMTDYSVQGIEEAMAINPIENYKNYILNLADEYFKYYNMHTNLTGIVTNTWINLQKKYEYRPCHVHSDHSGKGLSFVTYVDIPYDTENEDKVKNHTKKAVQHRNGRIEFIYTGFNGTLGSHIIDINKSFVGKTIIFVNSLMHIVYPFYTSDNYRVSIAGNINYLDTNKL